MKTRSRSGNWQLIDNLVAASCNVAAEVALRLDLAGFMARLDASEIELVEDLMQGWTRKEIARKRGWFIGRMHRYVRRLRDKWIRYYREQPKSRFAA